MNSRSFGKHATFVACWERNQIEVKLWGTAKECICMHAKFKVVTDSKTCKSKLNFLWLLAEAFAISGMEPWIICSHRMQVSFMAFHISSFLSDWSRIHYCELPDDWVCENYGILNPFRDKLLQKPCMDI